MKQIVYFGLCVVVVCICIIPRFVNAEDETAPDFCQKFCIGEPECCTKMRDSHDPFECEWPTRGWCKPEICNQIDGKKQRCGWYWLFHNANDNDYKLGTNSPNGYGCMIGDSEATMYPKCGPKPVPTSPPTPTLAPTAIPTPTTAPIPTDLPIPTTTPSSVNLPIPTNIPEKPIIIPTTYIPPPTSEPVIISPTEIPIGPYQGQGFSLPLVQIPTLPMVCSSTTVKPDPISYVFDKITSLDHSLENTINIKMLLLFYQLKSKLSH